MPKRIITIITALALTAAPFLLSSSTVSAVPQTTQGAAYKYLQQFMTDYNKTGFSKVASIGNLATYRQTLAGVKIVVDPNVTAVAVYDPNTNTIKFSKDPRKTNPKDASAMGETVWHELSHAIENKHGDIGTFDNEAYAERNVDYMSSVIRQALPVLELMEKKAKAGASETQIKALWDKFLQRMSAASSLPSTTQYPVDAATLQSWFGFNVNPGTIKAMYASGNSGLPKAANARLKKAFTAPTHPNINGVWTEPTGICAGAKTTIVQKADGTVTSITNNAAPCNAKWIGSNMRWTSPNVLELKYDFVNSPPGFIGGTLSITFAPDGHNATGAWNANGTSGTVPYTR